MKRTIAALGLCVLLLAAALGGGACSGSEPKPAAKPITGPFEGEWREWSDAAFAEAKSSGRPVLLLLTAAWSHDAHTLDLTVFADKRVAESAKGGFIPVRVDVDRRPDIADRYLGGELPALAVLSPDGYVLARTGAAPPDEIAKFLEDNLKKYRALTPELPRMEAERAAGPAAAPVGDKWDNDHVSLFYMLLLGAADEVNGGFGNAPKFPRYEALRFMLFASAVEKDKKIDDFLRLTLGKMEALSDPVWGGFFRYAETGDWKSPGSEKLLYDNAEAVETYLEAAGILGDAKYSGVAAGTIEYVEKFLAAAAAGFASGQDADTMADGRLIEGGEYYARDASGRARAAAPYVVPAVYADANGRMISALFRAHQALGGEKYLGPAEAALSYAIENGFKAGRGFTHDLDGGADDMFVYDQVWMIRAILDAYETTGRTDYLVKAAAAVDAAEKMFGDAAGGGFYDIPERTTGPAAIRERIKLMPENAAMAENLIRLYYYTGDERRKAAAERALDSVAATPESFGIHGAAFVRASYLVRNFPLEIAIIGEKSDKATAALLAEALKFPEPRKVVLTLDPKQDAARLALLPYAVRPEPVLYACVENACSMPVSDPANVAAQLKRFTEKFLGGRKPALTE